jgi:RND family efflux transporter MFP subunit
MRRSAPLACLAALLPLLAACKKTNQYVPPPPPKVSVAKPLTKPVTPYLQATGNITAINSVDLVARVQGFLQSISYTDGAAVKAGDVLFTIEPLPYQMKLQQAQASEVSAQATLTNAQIQFDRQQALQRNDVSSVQNLDNARAQRDTAQANLTSAQAGTQLAAITYAYTRVLAPFDGRVSAHLQSVGELVGTNPTTLATIVQLKPIWVTFTVSEQDVLRVRADAIKRGIMKMQNGAPTADYLSKIPVEVGLQSETGFPHAGHMDYIAPTVDPSTGTLQVRGILDNDDYGLLPGYFARVRVPVGPAKPEILVADTAFGTDQSGRYLLVVGANNEVTEKHVVTGPLDGTLRVVESGLSVDDSVIVDGLQRAVPGQAVAPTTIPMPDVAQ